MKKIYLLPIFIFLISCTSKEIEEGKSQHPVNLKMIQEANELFKNKLENQESYHSFSSNDVFYEIQYKNLSMQDFILYKEKILPEKKWIFLKKINQAYIFCKGSIQLEIIPPQILVGNYDLELDNENISSGDIGRQMKDKWNVIFNKEIHGGISACYSKYISEKSK